MTFKVAVQSIKRAFAEALKALPDFKDLNAVKIGDIVDKSFKSLMKDLMVQFGMEPDKDYIDNLSTTEPGADFVILSKEANDVIKNLLAGKIQVVKEHTRISKNGQEFTVKAHFRNCHKVV